MLRPPRSYRRQVAPKATTATPAPLGIKPARQLGETSGGCNASLAKPRGPHVGGFNGVQWLELMPTDEPIERKEMSISAWVKWDGPESEGEATSMQTVVSNKDSGCDRNSGHHGFAVFINEWNTNSGQLYLSWGNDQAGW